MDHKKILILGVGNTLLTDEGFGVRAVEYLQSHYSWPGNVRLMDGGTQGLMLMTELLSCDLLIVLDIILGPEKPGTVYCLEGESLRKSLGFRDSIHQLDLVDTLITCRMAGHDIRALVFGIQPFDYHSMHPELTPELRELLPKFCDKVVAALPEHGITALRLSQ